MQRFVALDGKIILFGSYHDAVTFLHYVDQVVDFPGKRIAHFDVPVLEGGQKEWKPLKQVNTSDDGAHKNWPDGFFRSMVDGHLQQTGNAGGMGVMRIQWC